MLNCCELIFIALFGQVQADALCDHTWTTDQGTTQSAARIGELYGLGTCNDPNPNLEPNIQNPGDQANTIGEAVSLQITATDPESDLLFWEYPALPSGLSGDQSGLITGTVSTEQTVTSVVQVDDSTNPPVSTSFNWIVNAVPIDPQCDNSIDDDNDGFTDLDDPGCDDSLDNDETDPPPTGGIFAMEEIAVDSCPQFHGAFGVSAGDFDGDGLGDIVAGSHYTSGNPTCHWEFNGSDRMVLQQVYNLPGCLNNLMSGDFNNDGYGDVMCRDVNSTTQTTKGLHITYGSLTGINPADQVKQICGAQNSSCYLVDNKLWDTSNDAWRDFTGQIIENIPSGFDITVDGLGVDLGQYTSCTHLTNGMLTAIGDIDNDGDKDLVYWPSNYFSNVCDAVVLEQTPAGWAQRSNVFQGDPAGTFGKGGGGSLYSNLGYGEIHLHDYNGDGYLDILTSGRAYNDLYDLGLNDGAGNFIWTDGVWSGKSRYTSSGSNQIRAGAAPFKMDADACWDIAAIDGEQGSLKVWAFRSTMCD